jgi:hypothetical protein
MTQGIQDYQSLQDFWASQEEQKPENAPKKPFVDELNFIHAEKEFTDAAPAPRKKKSRRVMGMTTAQLAILGGITFVYVIALTAFMIFLSGNNTPAAAAAPLVTNTPAPQPTSTPLPEPTVTPLPAPATEEPVQLPADWLKFESASAEIFLPPQYVGGDMLNNRAATIKTITALQTKKIKLDTATLQKSPAELILLMYDKNLRPGLSTVVYVYKYGRPAETSLDDFLMEMQGQMTGEVAVYSARATTVQGYEAKKLEFERKLNGQSISGVAYAIKNGGDFWFVNYEFQVEQLIDMTGVIKTSIKTLTFK